MDPVSTFALGIEFSYLRLRVVDSRHFWVDARRATASGNGGGNGEHLPVGFGQHFFVKRKAVMPASLDSTWSVAV